MRDEGSRATWQVTLLAVIAIIAAMSYAQVFLVPVILAFLLALVFSPFRRWGERRGVPPGVTASLVVLGLLSLLVAMTAVLAAPVTGWLDQAPEMGREIERKIGGLTGATQALMDAGKRIDDLTAGGDEVTQVVVRDVGVVGDVALGVPLVVAQAIAVLVLLFFLTASGDMISEKIVHVLPTLGDSVTAIRIVRQIERRLSRYLATITFINAGLGLAIALALWGLGMPNPALFGFLAFTLNFIPFIGAIAGTVLALLVGIVTYDEIAPAFAAASVYFLLTSIEGQLVTPHFVGRSLRLNPVVIFLSITFLAWIWSVMGMLLAVPLLVGLRTICAHVPRLQNFGDFLSARGEEGQKEVADRRSSD